MALLSASAFGENCTELLKESAGYKELMIKHHDAGDFISARHYIDMSLMVLIEAKHVCRNKYTKTIEDSIALDKRFLKALTK